MKERRPWTNDDIGRLKRFVQSGLTDVEIGEILKRRRDAVTKKRNELEIEPGQSRALTAMMTRINTRKSARTRM